MDKIEVVKSMKSKLNMHPDVRNHEVIKAFDIILDKWVSDRNLAISIHIYTSCKGPYIS